MSKTSPQNLVVMGAKSTMTAHQAMHAMRFLSEDQRTPHAIDALIERAQKTQTTTVVNDYPNGDEPRTYTVVTLDEPDCDGQTYSVATVEACNAPMADVLAEIISHNPCVAVYEGNIETTVREIWGAQWHPWAFDDTIGTVLDNTRD